MLIDALSPMHHTGRLCFVLAVFRLVVRMRLWLAKQARPFWRYGSNRRVVVPYGLSS